MSAEFSFATATVRTLDESLDEPGEDGIGEDFVILVSSLRAAVLATGTSQDFVGISCSP